VVFVLVDDVDCADVGAYAAAPNCSPARASILTGKWPARLGVTQYLPGNHLPYAKLLQAEPPEGLPPEETANRAPKPISPEDLADKMG
jgi:arylsulfatase A-like enzyme